LKAITTVANWHAYALYKCMTFSMLPSWRHFSPAHHYQGHTRQLR